MSTGTKHLQSEAATAVFHAAPGLGRGAGAELAWLAVPGAAHYQVFIKDLWDDGKIIHSSELVTKPRLTLPPGVIKADGSYAWLVHARDVNNHVLLGDFNHGSLSREVKFSTAAGL